MKPRCLVVVTLLMVLSLDLFAQVYPTRQQDHAVSWWHRSFGSLSWEDMIEIVQSPRDVCWQVRRHVLYREENSGPWFSSGRTVWELGHGDCKDFSSCVADICMTKGYICWITSVYPVGFHDSGHCIVIGIWHGRMWMSSNGAYYEVTSLDDVLKKLSDIRGWKGRPLEFVPLNLWY